MELLNKYIKNIIIISGINDLFLSMSQKTGIWGNYFFKSDYEMLHTQKKTLKDRLKKHQAFMKQCDNIVLFLWFFASLDCGCVLRSTFSRFLWILDRFGTPIWRHFGMKIMKQGGLKSDEKRPAKRSAVNLLGGVWVP